MAKRNEIVSIFGQIEEIVARQMMIEGKGIRLFAPTESVSLADIPTSCKFNSLNEPVRLVIVMPHNLMHEFERRIERMRS